MESASPPVAIPVQAHNYQNGQEGIWPNGPVQLARGRQAKDPNAKTVTYSVSSLDDFESSLREYLSNPPEQPEHTECQLSFWIGASFLVSAPPSTASSQPSHPQSHPPSQPHVQAPPGYQPANGIHPQYGSAAQVSHTYQSVQDPAIALSLPYHPQSSSSNVNGTGANNHIPAKDRTAQMSMSILEALAATLDPKEKMRKQRAIAKCCIDAIQKVDGYRYSFHNCWNSREDDSYRFSYYCNDSLLNKDRAANGKGAKLGKRATKPVYDCKGVLSVKFSASKQSLDIFYKHVPIHKTYEERAPPPRKDSKRRKFLEENDPEALIRIANRPRPPKPDVEEAEDIETPLRQKKKKKPKKEDEPKSAPNSIESDLRAQSLRSLLELIQTDPEPTSQSNQEPSQPQPVSQPHTQTNTQVQIQTLQADAGTKERPPQSTQPQPQQPRKRPRNSCDICKAKKTKCDGARPTCKTCHEKGRQCGYSDNATEEHRRSLSNPSQPVHHSEAIRQAQAADNELSELERMKRELEEAKARIQQLEAEKTRPSSTPSQPAPVPQPRPHSQPQPQPLPTPHPPHSQMQNQQIQTPAFFNNHANHAAYGLNRPMEFKNVPHPSQASGTHQMHASGTGLTPTQETNNPYGRDFWPTPFYSYQSTPPQPQQDQWAAARNPGVFRQ